ncbi:MAG: GGDEF domain-containing protein [Halobacteria archaeon]|nr:GGDEF domain-containing protein [Halobacteria archaeon]
MTSRMKRSTEEIVTMTLCTAGAVAITPFAVIRFFRSEWLMGSIDIVLILGISLVGLFVWWTRRVRTPGIILTIFILSGMVTIVYVGGISLVHWAYPTMVATYFLVKPREATAFNLLVMVLLIPAVVPEVSRLELVIILVTLILNNVFAYVFAARMSEHRKHLSFLAERDPLTGIGNRRALNARLEDIVLRRQTQIITASLLVLDLDHFKDINDTHGHGKGDLILVQVTEIISANIRVTDDLYRLGGEEFVVVAMGASRDAASKLAEQLRGSIEASKLLSDRRVTISLGVAEFKEGESYENWLDRADTALYEAKRTGRNRVCLVD